MVTLRVMVLDKMVIIFLKLKILVRYFDAPRLRNGLRITIGKKAEISALLDAIREILS